MIGSRPPAVGTGFESSERQVDEARVAVR